MQYFKSLNTLRAIAVLLVIIQHWSPLDSIVRKFLPGPFGVDIFFTLSGFLITSIILKDIALYRQMKRPASILVGHFFVRRVIRILPPYIFALLLTYILKSLLVRFDPGAWPYLLTFTFNYYIFKLQYWPGTIGHFWSLAVEEQYYLFWPFLMVFLSNRIKPILMVCMVILAIIIRYHLHSNEIADVTTLSCLDAFGLGSLLAWWCQFLPKTLDNIVKWFMGLIIFLLLLLPILNYYHWFDYIYFKRFTQSFIAFVLIAYLVKNESNQQMPFKWFWNSPILVFIGKISYGMYLYHLLIPDLPFPWYISNIIKLIILIIFSWASFTFFETPILSLKKFFR